MPDHFHMIIQPLMNDQGASVSLPRIFHSIKSFTSNKLTNVKGVAWQDEHYDHIIRTEEEYYEQIRYIENNPLEAGLATRLGEYKWLWHVGIGDMPTSI